MTPPEKTPSRATARAAAGAALLVLVAIAYGGATTHPAQAVVLIGLGLLWLLAPARRVPERGMIVCACGLLVLAATAWLPAAWFAAEPWRRGLASIGIPLPGTVSPQPWLSVEALLWLVIGLAWLAWLLGQKWNPAARRTAMRLLAGGLVLIAATALAARALHLAVPGWLSAPTFGPFPNRNHTGHVFALGGLLALGCAADAWRRDWRKALPWLLGAAVILVALVVNFSRGGLLLFLGAAALWSALEAWQRRSWKTLAVGASLVLVLVSLVLIGGGSFAARFAGGADSEVVFRVFIWRDTLALVHASPWCGAGLGNFQALFPLYRSASVSQQSVLHPESDWLWLATDLGWLGVVFALVVAFLVLRHALPLAPGSQRRLRGVALAAALAALLHAAIDVPGHRLGSALLALFVMVLARLDVPASPDSKIAAACSRVFGVLALAAAFVLARLPDETSRAQTLSRAGRFAESEAAADRALARAPLDWRAYFARAGARACLGKTLAALADFRRARLLEPHYAGVPFEEGLFWLQAQPALTLNAWRDAVRRSPDDTSLYGAMLDAAPDAPAFRAQLLALAQDHPALQLQWFQCVPPAEARTHWPALDAAARQATPAQRAAFQHHAEEIGAAPAPP
ncbi:MAG: O-antigen ligase family protein [Chthoniobacter sp.]|uniref:O-antigen ligase family protein n=1 Tax=Chthoniobacter sp. TaxID=2510640 RepID=UPI0032A45FF2